MAEAKKQISLARQQRAAHASEAMVEKYYDAMKIFGSSDEAELAKRKAAHLEALVACRETFDLFAEFPDDFDAFVKQLEGARELNKAAA